MITKTGNEALDEDREERAGILEFQAGLSRDEAECRAVEFHPALPQGGVATLASQAAPPVPLCVAVNVYDPYDVYVGRHGKGQDGTFGNYVDGPLRGPGSFQEKFLRRVSTDVGFWRACSGLRGKRIACPGNCVGRGEDCHARVIAEWVNAQPTALVKPEPPRVTVVTQDFLSGETTEAPLYNVMSDAPVALAARVDSTPSTSVPPWSPDFGKKAGNSAPSSGVGAVEAPVPAPPTLTLTPDTTIARARAMFPKSFAMLEVMIQEELRARTEAARQPVGQDAALQDVRRGDVAPAVLDEARDGLALPGLQASTRTTPLEIDLRAGVEALAASPLDAPRGMASRAWREVSWRLTDGSRPNELQKKAIDLVASGRNVFLTGPAGVGKSYVVNILRDRALATGHRLVIAATTGIAALNINGRTLHSFLGLRPGATTVDEVCDERWQRTTKHSIMRANTLLCDETSMCSGVLLDMAEALCRRARENDAPWGGLQIVLVGDMGQLPPVELEKEGFAFRSRAWALSELETVELTEVKRQSDAAFVAVLREIRDGTLSPAGEAMLGARVRAYDPDDPATPAVRLATHNSMVDNINAAKLAQLPGEAFTFAASDSDNGTAGGQFALQRLQKDCLSPAELRLRLGARVMFTRNSTKVDPVSFVNGSSGTVVDLSKSRVVVELDRGHDRVDVQPVEWTIERDRHVLASRRQLPLKLGWACTAHKCVHPDTLVETEAGLTPIKSISSEGMIATHDGARPYSDKVENPENAGLRILTEHGYELSVTPEHGLHAERDGAWRRIDAAELREGDSLRLVRGSFITDDRIIDLPILDDLALDVRAKRFKTPAGLTTEVAELLGLMVADGSVYKSGFRMAKRHKDVTDRFVTLCRLLFDADPKVYFIRNAWIGEVNSTALSRWLTRIGGTNPNAKTVPDAILRSPVPVQRAFLRGLFEDGSAHLKKKKNGTTIFSHIEWSTSLEPLGRITQTLLLRCGIKASRRKITHMTRGIERTGWRIWIYGENAARFRDEIGFIAAAKQCRLARAGGYGRGLEPIFHERIESITPITMSSVCVAVPSTGRFLQNGFDGFNSQGLTLERVSVDLTRAFAPGQSYVALSRCRTLEGLNIENWRGKASIFASEAVLAFARGEVGPVGSW